MKKLCCVLVLLWIPRLAYSVPLYINVDLTTGANDGSSWANAFRPVSDPEDPGCLQRAIDAAAAEATATGQAQEVWVKASATPYEPITLASKVRVYGGFAGTETLASQSSPWTNVTIIDGGDAVRCVTAVDTDNTAVLRGFHLRNGYAEGKQYYYEGGGGVGLFNSDAMIVNCAIYDNFAWVGAGVATYGGDPTLVNCKIYNNGVIYGPGNPPVELARCFGGGGVFSDRGVVTMHQCLIHANRAHDGGGYMSGLVGSAHLISCTITYNVARSYAGVFHDPGGAGGAAFSLSNTIVWGNVTTWYADSSVATIPANHCNMDNTPGTLIGTGNFYADPLYVDWMFSNFDITAASPCRNTGNNALLPPDVADLDWDGNTTEALPRDLSGSLRKLGGVVDVGAYEGPLTGGGGEQ